MYDVFQSHLNQPLSLAPLLLAQQRKVKELKVGADLNEIGCFWIKMDDISRTCFISESYPNV